MDSSSFISNDSNDIQFNYFLNNEFHIIFILSFLCRYNVSVPKHALLSFPDCSVVDLKKRYLNMYVPSDFFLVDHAWMKAFPAERAFKVHSPSAFHVFNKELVDR